MRCRVRRLSPHLSAWEDPRVLPSKAQIRQQQVPSRRRPRAPASAELRSLSARARQQGRMSELPQEVLEQRDAAHPVEALVRGRSPPLKDLPAGRPSHMRVHTTPSKQRRDPRISRTQWRHRRAAEYPTCTTLPVPCQVVSAAAGAGFPGVRSVDLAAPIYRFTRARRERQLSPAASAARCHQPGR